jgi:LysM repeat protein
MHKPKIVLIPSVLVALLFAFAIPVMAAPSDKTGISVDNQIFYSNLICKRENGIIMVPASELAKSLGGNFDYDSNTMTGTLSYGENQLDFWLDSSVAKHNGKYINAPAPMKVTGLRFMVPALFSYDKLGAEAYDNVYKNMIMVFKPEGSKLIYSIMQGDTLWIISQGFNTSISTIKANNGLSSDMIYVGQKLYIKDFKANNVKYDAFTSNSATVSTGTSLNVKAVGYLKPWTEVKITGKNASWFKVETPVGKGYIHDSVTWIKQDISDNGAKSTYFENVIPVDTSKNYISYQSYTVVSGDSIWAISQKFGIPDFELASANNMSRTQTIHPNQVLQVPVHNIPVKETAGAQYGEILDWFSEGQYIFPLGATGKLTDMATGKSFMVKRTTGANHSDTETLTWEDTNIMKSIFGGYWNWNRRPFILEHDGRCFAVSVSGMPHAGVDNAPYMQNVSNRTGDYGYGPNYDMIKGNGMDGHFDLYFLNCLRHKDNKIDPLHQQLVLTAGGLR